MEAHVDDVTINCRSCEKMGQRAPVDKTKLAALSGSSFESTENLVLYIPRYNIVPTIDSAVHSSYFVATLSSSVLHMNVATQLSLGIFIHIVAKAWFQP
jgi:hypothetical protein